mmetsp:Transcript_87236/g.182570  ORF Transcript_87236/g.182570 Transcript_87236/m.182570 type:complete len:424 (-) Transcript_87236:331-1602(-)|eukprot:CAMPEP_0206481588 /NCGR_PEP_ID=MMETSP0324_2-20121206/38248_1 /ASSEMBLY_ACC=CAM_ASM_000836 /TAXON_ID=2866 /ORGANISM="Crypthecodinium cohnii, Strain Seligo" /LENGTH=423 /DNA_ID=CAMNT_0053959133 /DNA_START=336 /DNA_END=1607 /DNA_ORIENTATION=+
MADECGELGQFDATVNVLKGMIGLGLLSLPHAAKEVGWLPALVGTPLLAWLSAQGVLYAMSAEQKVNSIEEEDKGVPTETTGLVRELSDSLTSLTRTSRFETGLGSFDGVVRVVFGRPGQALCTCSILLCQLGTAVAYITVLVPSILDISGHPLPDGEGASPSWTLLVGLWAVLSVMSLLKSLKEVAFISLLGLLTYLLVFAALAVESAQRIHEGTFARDFEMIRWNGAGWGTWFGVSIFAFGAFPIAIAVSDTMQEPSDMYPVLRWSFGIAGVFYTVFAIVGYACYGNATKNVVHFNFPEHSLLRQVSLIALVVVLVFTYVLQMNPVYKFAEGYLRRHLHHWYIRTIIVAITMFAAVLVPDTAAVIQVAGSISTAMIGLIMPPLVYLGAGFEAKQEAAVSEYPLAMALVVVGVFGLWRSLLH